MSKILKKTAGPVILSCLWLIMILLVNPVGEFPLGDDWSYSRVVHTLVEHGVFEYTDWVAMPLIVHVFWGALFCSWLGFSFTALRISTLVMGLVGILGTYGLSRKMGSSRKIAFFIALLLATNPLYFVLSHSFFTDVPFCALSILALWFFVNHIKGNGVKWLIGATILSVLAVLIRQIGILLPVAVAVALVVRRGFKKEAILATIVPPLIVIAAYLGFNQWIESTIGLPELYHQKTEKIFALLLAPFPDIVATVLSRFLDAMLYLGLFLLPVLFFVSPFPASASSTRSRKISFGIISTTSLVMALYLLLAEKIMPVSGNWLYDLGMGTPTLTDVFMLKMPNIYEAPVWIWFFITVFSILGCGLLVERIVMIVASFITRGAAPADRRVDKWWIVLVCVFFLLYMAPICMAGFFDRYLILLLPFFFVLLATGKTEMWTSRFFVAFPVALVTMILFAYFSIAATHDYLSWNRARWEACNELTEVQQIPSNQIDGGFEFNGWHMDPDSLQPFKRKWWVYDDTYMITFGPIRGYSTLERFEYPRWLPGDRGEVLILERKSP